MAELIGRIKSAHTLTLLSSWA